MTDNQNVESITIPPNTHLNIYELNRSGIEQTEKPMSTSEVKIAIANQVQAFLDNVKDTYCLLFCKAKSDFVIFHLNERKWETVSKDIFECVTNRGQVYLIESDADGNEASIDIWVKGENDEMPHLYKFFACDIFVIEEGE